MPTLASEPLAEADAAHNRETWVDQFQRLFALHLGHGYVVGLGRVAENFRLRASFSMAGFFWTRQRWVAGGMSTGSIQDFSTAGPICWGLAVVFWILAISYPWA